MTNIDLTSYDIISFDVFDTAVFRISGSHHATFFLVRARLQSDETISFRYPAVAIGFVWMRREAEAAARRERAKEEGDSEVTFDEIYDVFAEVAGIPLAIARTIQKIELEIETSQLCVNPEIYSIWRQAYDAKRRIVFLSDMYHSSQQIALWLSSLGYRDPEVYVSCEHRKSKHVGNLFDVLNSDSVCHIGDNYIADIEHAPKTWTTFHYQYTFQHPQYVAISKPEGGLLSGPLRALGNLSPAAALGASVFGPLVLGFLLWVDASAPADVPLILFSRDGYVLQQLLLHMFPHRQSYYVDSSRIATLVPSLYSFEAQKIERYLAGKTGQTVQSLLQLYGLHNPSQYTDIVLDAGFRSMSSLVTRETMKQFTSVLARLQYEIQKSSVTYLRSAQQYLNKFDTLDRVIFIDLGWSGSMQGQLSQILNVTHPTDITGLYYQLWNLKDFKRHSVHDTYKSYLQDVSAPHSLNHALQHGGVEILETVLSEPTGTTLRYEDGLPVREEYVHPQARTIYEIQDGIKQYVDMMLPLLSKVDSSTLIMYMWNEPFARMVLFPTAEEAEMIGSFEHSDGIGQVAGREIALAPIVPLAQIESQKDNAYWTQGFILRNQRET